MQIVPNKLYNETKISLGKYYYNIWPPDLSQCKIMGRSNNISSFYTSGDFFFLSRFIQISGTVLIEQAKFHNFSYWKLFSSLTL